MPTGAWVFVCGLPESAVTAPPTTAPAAPPTPAPMIAPLAPPTSLPIAAPAPPPIAPPIAAPVFALPVAPTAPPAAPPTAPPTMAPVEPPTWLPIAAPPAPPIAPPIPVERSFACADMAAINAAANRMDSSRICLSPTLRWYSKCSASRETPRCRCEGIRAGVHALAGRLVTARDAGHAYDDVVTPTSAGFEIRKGECGPAGFARELPARSSPRRPQETWQHLNPSRLCVGQASRH